MTSCRQYSTELCSGTCGGSTLHDPGGCIHRKTCGGVRQARAVAIVQKSPATPCAKPKQTSGIAALSALECRVLGEIAIGGPAGAIGKRLGISSKAVQAHRGRICKKLGLVFVHGTDVLTDFARNSGAVVYAKQGPVR